MSHTTATSSMMMMMMLMRPAGRRGPGQLGTSVVLRRPHGPRPSILAVGTQPRLRRHQARVPVQVARPGRGGPGGLELNFCHACLYRQACYLRRKGPLLEFFFPSSHFHKGTRWAGGGPSGCCFSIHSPHNTGDSKCVGFSHTDQGSDTSWASCSSAQF